MTTTNGNRKVLDRKRWEFMTPAPAATLAGAFVSSCDGIRQQQMYVTGVAAQYLYNPNEDAYVQLPSAALAGTFGAGAAGVGVVSGPSGTATAGGASTLTTNLTLARDLRGYQIMLTGGPGAGDVRTIASNTIGANGVVTVTAPFSATPTTSTTYHLMTPRWFVLSAGTLAANAFKVYDFALNTWTAKSITTLPATIGTDGKLVATPSWVGSAAKSFATGTATAGGASTLTNGAKSWASNQWANSQIRITAGTGAGQIRTIASNTGTVITTSAAWATNPDATSVYSIEGNDDFLYYLGNNAVTLYRYTISTDTWAVLTPGAARAGAPGAGMSAHWVSDTGDATWQAESAIMDGRYIYSFRGAGGAVLDRYDIAANTWVSAVTYGPSGGETFSAGSKYALIGQYLYMQKDATGRWFRFNFVTSELEGWATALYPSGAAVVGDTCFNTVYSDGATSVNWVQLILNTSTVALRQMVI